MADLRVVNQSEFTVVKEIPFVVYSQKPRWFHYDKGGTRNGFTVKPHAAWYVDINGDPVDMLKLRFAESLGVRTQADADSLDICCLSILIAENDEGKRAYTIISKDDGVISNDADIE